MNRSVVYYAIITIGDVSVNLNIKFRFSYSNNIEIGLYRASFLTRHIHVYSTSSPIFQSIGASLGDSAGLCDLLHNLISTVSYLFYFGLIAQCARV